MLYRMLSLKIGNINVLSLSERTVIAIFRLKDLREKYNISQVKLAMDLNLNQNSISRYENEEREADYKTLIALADYFNVSIDYLLGRTDNPELNTSPIK